MIYFNPTTEDNPNIDMNNPEAMQPIVFYNNGEKLIGTIFKATGFKKKQTVILLHGFPGNENNFDIAHAIKRFGFNVIVFHYRGSWGSGGSFSISNSLEDVSTAIDYFSQDEISIKYNIDKNNFILIGHSMGGFLAFLTSIKYPKIKNIALLAGFNFGFFSDYLLQNPQFIEATMDGLSQGAMLLQGTSKKEIYNEMQANKDEWNLLKRIFELKGKSILLVGAQFDYVAPLELHHTPLVNVLRNAEIKVKSEVYKSGHSFSSARIKLSTEIIEWLIEIGKKDIG